MANIITKKQRAVLNDIFIDGLSESAAIEKNAIDAATYRRWLSDSAYLDEIQFHIESAQREGKLLIARHCAFAAAKLVQLAGSDKEETARKACLDIIGAYQVSAVKSQPSDDNEQQTDFNISPNQAEKILQILAMKEA